MEREKKIESDRDRGRELENVTSVNVPCHLFSSQMDNRQAVLGLLVSGRREREREGKREREREREVEREIESEAEIYG